MTNITLSYCCASIAFREMVAFATVLCSGHNILWFHIKKYSPLVLMTRVTDYVLTVIVSGVFKTPPRF